MTIPSTVKTIRPWAFARCGSLRSLTIEEGVTNISNVAFHKCPLKSVTIPKSVVNIGDAFADCGELESVTMLGEKPNAPKEVFRSCPKLKEIHVPANAKSWAGMKEWQGKKLVFDAKVNVPYRARTFDQTRKEVAKLFPGWSLDTEVQQLDIADADSGFRASHRGQKNVICLHPMGEGRSAILSRSVTLSDKNPCLFLKVASYAEKVKNTPCDFLLSVRVNRKDALSNRRICTPDSAPWKDVSVPLSAWRGQTVKIEVMLTADGWWYEFPYLARLEVGEGNGEAKSTVGCLYCIIDISGGTEATHYPVSYLDAVPQGGWGEEYKTKKIVLRRIDAGTYPTMIRYGVNRKVTFTKPFYMGIFELTQKQIKLVSGERQFVYEGDQRPADCLCYEEMRGKDTEFDYPKTKEVAGDSIIGKLRAKTGIVQIDLPTSYQFGCAWNAGTEEKGRDACSDGRHASNRQDGKGGFKAQHTTVGSYQPNEWGIYDLHGNVWEICVNRTDDEKAGVDADPEGPSEGERRSVRGGGWNSADTFISAEEIPSTRKGEVDKTARPPTGMSGCRIVINAAPCLFCRDVGKESRTTIQSIIDGMIKVPGKDYWLSETELTQGQWEAVMGNNPSQHKGANLPVENVSRDDCDVFLEKLNQTSEVQSSRFEFRLPERHEWANAARTGLPNGILIETNVLVSNLLDIAWLKENSNGQTHGVAAKLPNAWGFYDMVGNVHEWVIEGTVPEKQGTRRGYSFREDLAYSRLGWFFFSPKNVRMDSCGIRVAAHIRTATETCPDNY